MHTVCFKYVAKNLKRFHKAKINTEFSAQLSLKVLLQHMPLVAYSRSLLFFFNGMNYISLATGK